MVLGEINQNRKSLSHHGHLVPNNLLINYILANTHLSYLKPYRLKLQDIVQKIFEENCLPLK